MKLSLFVALVTLVSSTTEAFGFDLFENSSRPQTCGLNKFKTLSPVQTYIIGGSEATPNFYQWQVSLQYVSPFSTRYCGGSIISDQWVLTAAHCTESGDVLGRWRVYAGKHYLFEAEPTQQEYGVTDFIVHESYNRPTRFNNDVAVVKLSRPITFDANIQPICLVEPDFGSLTGSYVTVTGWGATTPSGSDISAVLKQATVKVVSTSQCQRIFADTITDGMFCEGDANGGLDVPFKGDSGGPVALKVGDAWTQVGIVSWGPSNPSNRFNLAVSTRVSTYVAWINAKTGLGFNSAAGLMPNNVVVFISLFWLLAN